MPYSNIVFVKIKMELLEDARFLADLNQRQKGLYIMLLALAGKTENHIRDDMSFIKNRLYLEELERSDLERISEIFPKFNCSKGYWKFGNFEEIHNYVLGKSKGKPKETKGTVQKEKEKEKEKEKTPQSFDDLVKQLQNEPAYKSLNVLQQANKAKAWLNTNAPKRKFTKKYLLNWLNKSVDDVIDTSGSQEESKKNWVHPSD